MAYASFSGIGHFAYWKQAQTHFPSSKPGCILGISSNNYSSSLHRKAITMTVKDPVCGMEIDPKEAFAAREHMEQTFSIKGNTK
jgi:hypothetical protein